MDLRIFTEPQQGASHADLLAVAQATRDGGFSAFFRSDHVLAMGDSSGLPGPSDSFVNLGAIAARCRTSGSAPWSPRRPSGTRR